MVRTTGDILIGTKAAETSAFDYESVQDGYIRIFVEVNDAPGLTSVCKLNMQLKNVNEEPLVDDLNIAVEESAGPEKCWRQFLP